MIMHGYVKSYQYSGDGTMKIQVRVPAIHGPFSQKDYNGQKVTNYTRDEDLPYYESLLLPHTPVEGEVVTLMSLNEKTTHFLVIGLTGGSYYRGTTDI